MAETVKLNLRLPPEVHAAASEVAGALGVSLNTFILHAVANWANYQGGRLRQGKPVAYAPPMPAAGTEPIPPKAAASRTTVVAKVGANQPCPCGSGQKYKRCHGKQ